MSKITVPRVKISHLSHGTCPIKHIGAKSYVEKRKTCLIKKIHTTFMFLDLEN